MWFVVRIIEGVVLGSISTDVCELVVRGLLVNVDGELLAEGVTRDFVDGLIE